MRRSGDGEVGGILEAVRFTTASGAGYTLLTTEILWDFRRQRARRRVGAVTRDGAGCLDDDQKVKDRDLELQRCWWTDLPTLDESFVCRVLPLFDRGYFWITTPVVSIACSGIRTGPEAGWPPPPPRGEDSDRKAGLPRGGRHRPAARRGRCERRDIA